MIENYRSWVEGLVDGPYQRAIAGCLEIAGIAVLAVLVYYVMKGLLYLLDYLVSSTETSWDDDLLDHRLLRSVARLAPALTVNWLLPRFFNEATGMFHWTDILTQFYIVWTVVHLINVALSNLYFAMLRREKLKSYAVKGVFQMLKLICIGLGVIVCLSLLVGRTPLSIITAIGASAAVLMLVFRDTILGLVASVQLTANEMLHKGDWIIAPKYDVNGEVVDVSLTTVKVRNWDNSISTIPPYSLISDSFRNYQAMRDAGGRRVERSVLIDMNSIRFLPEEHTDTLLKRGFLTEQMAAEAVSTVNLALFRKYLEHFLAGFEEVNHEMLYMIRELEPTPQGLPLQIYFFTRIVEWKEFEEIQGRVMDHVYAAVREFGLEIYQAPAGSDFLRLSTNHFSGPGVSKNV